MSSDGVPARQTTPPEVVFLHGFMGSGDDWTDVVARLAGDVTPHTPDLPGRIRCGGRIPEPIDYVRWLAEAVDTRRLENPALVGYSMGGRLALWTALEHPERFPRLVLESASPGLKTAREREMRRKADRALADRLGGAFAPFSGNHPPGSAEGLLERAATHQPMSKKAFRAFLEDWYAMPIFASLSKRPGLLEALIEKRLRLDPADLGTHLTYFSTGVQPSLWDRLGELVMPTLLIVGEEDRKFRRIAEEMVERSPRIAVEVLSGCGHNVHLENPDAYTTVVRSFLCA